MKTDLNRECENLEIIIDNLRTGKEICEISGDQFSLHGVIDYLCGFLYALRSLNDKIIDCGNTQELLKEVHDKYNELWMFQLEFTIDSLPRVIGGLWRYPYID